VKVAVTEYIGVIVLWHSCWRTCWRCLTWYRCGKWTVTV